MIDIVKVQEILAAAHGVSGYERPVAEIIADMARPYADKIKRDNLGNLIVRKKGDGKRIMFSAHMDSIGFIATFIEKEGFIRFAPVGYHAPEDIVNIPVVFSNGVRGVLSRDGQYNPKEPKLSNLFIDIGAKDYEEAVKQVKPGDTAAFACETYVTNGNIVSPYLDNRIGCAVLLKALSMINKSENDLYFVFSAQEEVGLRGAKTAAYSIEPDYGIAVDVTLTGDIPEAKNKMECSLGKGAAIKIMDSSVMCSPVVVAMLERIAEENSIPVQREILASGGTDAGAIQTSRVGVFTGAVSIPTRYIHSPSEMACLSDIEAAASLIAVFASETW